MLAIEVRHRLGGGTAGLPPEGLRGRRRMIPHLSQRCRIIHPAIQHDIVNRRRVLDVGNRIRIEHEHVSKLADLE